MKDTQRILIVIAFLLAVVLASCSSEPQTGEHQDSGSAREGQEESGAELALDETYDQVRSGARLILVYDAESNSFVGTVANTTETVLKQVRVEVHLSDGTELGPTTPTDLEPGESIDVTLVASSDGFDGWTAHPEVGGGEGEHGGEGEGEHGGEGEHEDDD